MFISLAIILISLWNGNNGYGCVSYNFFRYTAHAKRLFSPFLQITASKRSGDALSKNDLPDIPFLFSY